MTNRRPSLRERYATARNVISLVPSAAAIYARWALAACSVRGYVGFQGLVYGATNASSDPGFIVVDYLDRPLPPSLRAVAGAEVVIEPCPSDDRDERCAGASGAVRVVSARDGHFVASTLMPGPRRREFTVSVTARGFESLGCRFRQERVMHQAVIVLRRL